MKTMSKKPENTRPADFWPAHFPTEIPVPTADYLWTIQYRIISELAEKGPCVIVGRCAGLHSPG